MNIEELPNHNQPIEFQTMVGWLKGKRIPVTIHGFQTSFFVTDEIEENRHWATFKENEIFNWKYLNKTQP